MKYYDLSKNWTRRVEPHLGDEELNRVLVRDFNRFTLGHWGKRFEPGMLPRDFETGGWWWGHRGRRPRFWAYVKQAACHWLVNFNLRLATLAEPQRRWRIVTSELHSTVWDNGEVLFDFNFLALGVPAEVAWGMVSGGRRLRPGR